jgi:hypothetical protein
MKRLLTIVAVLFFAHGTQAAEISIVAQETPNHPAIILIKGQFMKDDYQKDVTLFSALAGYQKNAIVFFNSPGGQLRTALDIGLVIYQHGFSTAVAPGTVCTSACALAWLGGKERFMGNGARIGFHAARVGTTNEISSVGNAMIGAFLVQVGIKEIGTIAFVTQTRPETFTWLTLSDAIRYHIAAKAFSFSQDEWSWAQQELDPSNKTAKSIQNPLDAATTVNATFAFKILSQPVPETITPPMPPSEDHCVPSGTRGCHCRLIDQVMICNAIPLPVSETIVPPVPQRACRLDETCHERVIEQGGRASPGLIPAVQIQSNDLIARALRRINDGDVATAREILAAADDGSQGLVAFALAEYAAGLGHARRGRRCGPSSGVLSQGAEPLCCWRPRAPRGAEISSSRTALT